MQAALALAEKAVGLSDPNPRVGCVIVDAQGHLLGQGHTQQAGGPHAEIMALRAARDAGHSLQGATVYVTLEPCAHFGRTAPCANALIEAGPAKVVAALEDPNPKVAGQGLAALRQAGIEVELGLMAEQAAELNIGFLHRMRTGRPFVRLKWASSLDGRTAHPDGHSQWITGDAARLDNQAWRRRAGAIVTGVGTVLADDPRLDVRALPTSLQPLRVVLDSQARTPPTARILLPPGQVLLLHAEGAHPVAALNAECRAIPRRKLGLDLEAVLAHLAEREINELHVEAGARLNGSWLAAGRVDELLIYQAPRLIGPGRACADLAAPLPLDEAHRWRWHEVQPIGTDLRLRLRSPHPSAKGNRASP